MIFLDQFGYFWLKTKPPIHPDSLPAACTSFLLYRFPFWGIFFFFHPSIFVLMHLVQRTALVCSAGAESVSNVHFKCQRSWIAYNPMVKHTLFANIKRKHFEVKNKARASTITSASSTPYFHQWPQCNVHKESKTWPSKAFINFCKNRYERFFFFLHHLQELGCRTTLLVTFIAVLKPW